MEARTLSQPMELGDGSGGVFRYSAQAMVSWRVREAPIWRGGKLRGYSETMGPPSPGTATADREAISIESSGGPTDGSRSGQNGRWGYLELRAVQTSSSSLQISLPGDRLVQLCFTVDSPKRWEDLLRQLVREAYQRAGRGFVREFQPRIAVR